MQIKPHRPLVLWRFTDGKPGHEKQTLGLCEALGRETTTSVFDIPVQPGLRNLMYWATGNCPFGHGLPAPDLLVGAGHATHLPILAARRAHGGKAIVLMLPSLPLRLFDLCLIPEHDRPPVFDNVIPTQGAINPVRVSSEHDSGRGLILVGGPSPHFAWEEESIALQIQALTESRPEVQWALTTSRRTPNSFSDRMLTSELEYHPFQSTPNGWLEEQLSRAGEVWTTPDSVSMVYEALSAGCRVGLFKLPAVPGSRVARGVADLIAKQFVSQYQPGSPSNRLPRNISNLSEAHRCARIILDKWFK